MYTVTGGVLTDGMPRAEVTRHDATRRRRRGLCQADTPAHSPVSETTMPPPRRASIMSYSASSRRNSSVKTHTVEFDENEAFLSVPPLDLMDHIVGYETISFDAMCVPPPPASRLVLDQEQEYCSIETQHPTLTEQQVRQALMIHIAKHSCYGHDAAKTQVITALQASSAFHYQLETFTERRENSWAYTSFSPVIEIDGPDNGPAPLPWEIPVTPRGMFEAEVKTLKIRCLHCHGDGFSSEYDYKERCFYCRSSTHGFGRLDCLRCKASGRLMCQTCEGTGLMIYYILLTVTWKTNTSEFIKKNVSLPEKFVRFVSGEEIFSQISERIKPLSDFPEETIIEASKDLVYNHISTFTDQKILMQRQSIRAVPITQVKYRWKGYEGQYYVFGKENRVHAPDYPQTCCCGCNII
ncbi:protein SSUH2 homolog isoform X2 [Homalodisca vitripennis]|uniref:protein SSUH2 homolog isoform X2 n=1 Tax=Homalodisca vitripennis TaxID=197043 RepID=UPI001EEA36D8|nr:protein SSUH2 homolog isoform X2 [Homalodisca vitripennis]